MIKKKRQRIEPTDDWQQLDLLIGFPEQRIYELCRPVVLFGRSVAERARQTATPQRTLYRQVDRFEREGMRSLFAPEKVEKHRRLPERIRRAVLELKVEHPDFRPHEIKTICWVRFGHSLSHHTVQRILAEGPVPERKRRRFEPYHRIPDVYDRRHALVTLHAEGSSGLAQGLPKRKHPTRELPDLRARPPRRRVPWERRARTWLRDRTSAGREEGVHDGLIGSAIRQVSDCSVVLATISSKGGTGKSTFSLTEGLVLSQYPLARPVVVEVNPDWGNLRQHLGDANPRTLVDLLENIHTVEARGLGKLQEFVTMWDSVPVITAPLSPSQMRELTPRDYDRLLGLLRVHYNVVILDCGTSFTNPLNQWAIQAAGHIQLVGWPEAATMEPLIQAIDYLASEVYTVDYRGELAEIDRVEMRSLAMADMTLIINGAGSGSVNPIDTGRIRGLVPELAGVLEVPYSEPLRRMLADSALTLELMPTPYRRAVKRVLATVLTKLAHEETAG